MAGAPRERRLRFMRFALTAFIGISYAVSFGVLYVTLAPLGALDVIVTWTGIFTIVSVLLALAIYYGYKLYIEESGQ